MKKILYTFALVSFLAYTSNAQDTKPASGAQPAAATKPAVTAQPASTVKPMDAKSTVTTAPTVPATTTIAKPAVDNPNAPEISFETDMHDYGTIKQGADGGCEFKFTNTGK